LVRFWDISVGDIFLAIPFALLLTILFYFDHNGKWLGYWWGSLATKTNMLHASIVSDCSRN
jgi:hypothetical protein